MKNTILRNAAVYNHNAHKLISCIVQKGMENENIRLMCIPDIILCAFTCELYLKDLIYKESVQDEYVRGHKLDELYLLLSDNVKNYIKDETLEGLKTYCPNREYDFDQSLKENGNAFVEVRYFYENNIKIDYLFLTVLVEVLENISRQINKNSSNLNE